VAHVLPVGAVVVRVDVVQAQLLILVRGGGGGGGRMGWMVNRIGYTGQGTTRLHISIKK
jgi:hypothetical protein